MTEQDSEDFLDAEIVGAIAAPNVELIITKLKGLQCAQCSNPLEAREHHLRRKAPHLYWRVRLECAHIAHEFHQEFRVFRMDWAST
jgi:hypothetical protein